MEYDDRTFTAQELNYDGTRERRYSHRADEYRTPSRTSLARPRIALLTPDNVSAASLCNGAMETT